jgi:hypothetical protein
MVAPGRFAAGRLLLVLLAAGCGDVDAGSASFVGAVRYEDTSGAFAISLLEPPWIPVSVAGQSFFLVPPSDATIPADVTQALSMALYSLQVVASSSAPMEAMDALWAGLPKEDVTGPSAVTTASGGTGLEVSWRESDTVFHRDAFITRAGSQTFQLHFTGPHTLDGDAMLTQMIVSFEPR